MAAMSSTDMDYKLQQKGKLLRPDRDKKSRQQEAYKWRDARRVYLAGSFDRWKRLRSKLGLKDSRLAWHLLEAHANHCVECGMMDSTDSDVSSKEFFPALVKSVRRLCQKHFSFKHSVEVVGLLCLNVDNEEKENYSIKELIQRPIGLRVEALSSKANSASNRGARQPLGETNGNVHEVGHSRHATCLQEESESSSGQRGNLDTNDGQGESLEYFSDDDDDVDDEYADATEPDTSTDNISLSETVSSSQECTTNAGQQTALSQSIVKLENMEIPILEQQNTFSSGAKCTTKKINKEEFSFLQMTPHLLFSEFSTLYPNISKRTFYRWKKQIADAMDFIHQNQMVDFCEFQKMCSDVSEEVFIFWKTRICEQLQSSSPNGLFPIKITEDQLMESDSAENVSDCGQTEAWTVQNVESESDETIRIVLKNRPTTEQAATESESCDIESVEKTPDDMPSDVNAQEHNEIDTSKLTQNESPSVFGSECKESNNEIQDNIWNKSDVEYGGGETALTTQTSAGAPLKMEFTDSDEDVQTHAQDHLDSSKRKLDLEESAVDESLQGDRTHVLASDCSSMDLANSVRKKRKYTSLDGIQHRREVYQKEEYELLEAMPFADYAEFSRHCPNVMKRTYFRWKRRIKEEYMYLEQNVDMSFEDFNRVFPQAKQNIFAHWKMLIKQGYNFSTVHYTSDSSSQVSSADTEASVVSDDGVKQTSYNFLQKNYQMEFSDFCKHFPTVTEQTFTVWKKKIQQEVQFLMSNPYYEMDYAIYSQCFPGVSKEVFSTWKRNMQQLLGNPQSAASLYTAASYQSPFLSQAARYGSLPWSDMKPNLWMNNPLLTHMWGTAMNLSASARSEEVGKQYFPRSNSLPTEDSTTVTHAKSSPTSEHSPSDLGMEKQSPFRQTEADFASPRSRKQNKAEFYHFLQHPEMDFHDMSVAFPNLSLRTFYRWKREIKNAMCILEESHSTPFSEFHVYFPDIPVDIFNKWKEKISSADPTTSTDFNLNSSRSNASSISKDVFVDDLVNAKDSETEFQFLKGNPYISFSQFSLHFPHVSKRTFYAWFKEIQNRINYIRKNPSVSYEEFQQHFSDISFEVFQAWRDLILSEKSSVLDFDSDKLQMNLGGSSIENCSFELELGNVNLPPKDLSIKHENFNEECPDKQENGGTKEKLVHKANRPEYVFLQNNPTVDFRKFFFRFPEVSGTTFYRWRREIKEIMDYIQLRPSTTYQEVLSYFPEISEDVFAHWKSIIQSGSRDRNMCSDDQDPMGSLQAMVDNRTKDDDTQEAFCYVMENPDVDKDTFSKKYPTLSQKHYYKWKKKVKELLLMLHGNPEMNFRLFSVCSRRVPENVFIKWKDNLTFYLDKAVSSGVEQQDDLLDTKMTHTSEEWTSPKSRKVNQAEFLFFLMNPFMDYQEFANNFPQISLRTFYRWRRETRDGLEYLEEYPDVSYKAFSQMFPVVIEEVFHKWNMLISVRNKVKNKACKQDLINERLSIHVKKYDTSSKLDRFSDVTHLDNNYQSLQANCSPSNISELNSPTSLSNSGDGNQNIIPINSNDDTSNPDHQVHKSDSPKNFIGFLSAAVENICKSAGLPPLDQSESSSEARGIQLSQPSSSVGAVLRLGGVVFPELMAPDRPQSNCSSHVESEQASSAEDNDPGLGGIAFPGMSPASWESTRPNTINKANPATSNTSGDQVQNMNNMHITESGLTSQVFSSMHFSELSLPTSSGFLPYDRQTVKSESLASSPNSDQTGIAISRISSPSFGLEQMSVSSRSSSNIITTASPVSGLKSGSSASGKNGIHDDYFFSPRLRKQNREEYMYLQQNPSMDFQEFYKVYPTISLRTFYRWKREFREDIHMSSFQQKENTNTLNTDSVQHGQILDLSAKPGNVYNHSLDSQLL